VGYGSNTVYSGISGDLNIKHGLKSNDYIWWIRVKISESQNWLFNGLKSIGIPIAQPIPICWFMSTVDGSCQAIDVHRSSSTPTPCRRLWDPSKGTDFGTLAMNGLE
jgi:hypothetical protein